MDTNDLTNRLARIMASWTLQQALVGYTPKLVHVAAERALGAALDKARPISEPAYFAAVPDLLVHELSLQVDWMQRQAKFLNGEESSKTSSPS